MNICIRLAPAYPPDIGEPLGFIPAPLDTITTVEPGRSGLAKTARPTSNAILTSTFQGAENDSQVCSSIGAIRGRVPAATTTRSGSASASSAETSAVSVASRSLPEARTWTPASRSASAVAWPTPLAAPMTSALSIRMVFLHGRFLIESQARGRIHRPSTAGASARASAQHDERCALRPAARDHSREANAERVRRADQNPPRRGVATRGPYEGRRELARALGFRIGGHEHLREVTVDQVDLPR